MKGLGNRQRVINPRKRERYAKSKKTQLTRLSGKGRESRLDKLLKISSSHKKD